MGKKLFGNSSSGGRFSDPRPGASTAPRRETPETGRTGTPSADRTSTPSPQRTGAPTAARAGVSTGARTRTQERPRPQAPQEPEQASGKQKKAKKKKGQTVAIVLLSILLVLELLYCVAIFTDIPGVKRLRDLYIQTAMTTKSHHWLATAFIPYDIIRDVMDEYKQARESQMGMTSNWGTEPTEPTETKAAHAEAKSTTPPATEPAKTGEEEFYDLFPEIDRTSFEAYVKEYPEVLDEGWENIYINEAALYKDGTSIETTEGDQVLAVDVPNQILLIRVSGTGYRGVLAIAKKNDKLHLYTSQYIGGYGEFIGDIATANNGVLAVTGSGFLDPNGEGDGGDLAGYCMANGVGYGYHYGWGYKRLELHEDHRFYITDAYDGVSEGTTDAVEFWPAMVLDGEIVVNDDWAGINPRCAVGQTKDEAYLMLVIEGRLIDSLGTDVAECSRIMARYGAYQAMNMDGGTSAMMWYDGEYITRCSNTALPEGRYLPNAWVYTK